MSHRYRFIAEVDAGGRKWVLDADETQHLAKVLRIEVGDEVEVTDGRGRWAVGRVGVIGSKRVEVEAEGFPSSEAAAKWPLRVCIGALKPGLIDEILPGMTELGVDEVHVFQQQESAKTRLADKAVERWHRIVVQAVKQCKRAWLPRVVVHGSVREMIDAAGDGGGARFLLAPDAEATLLSALTVGAAGEVARVSGVWLAVGGEKGFSADEDATLRRAGFGPVGLGPFVLRAVTAALSACSVAAAVRFER